MAAVMRCKLCPKAIAGQERKTAAPGTSKEEPKKCWPWPGIWKALAHRPGGNVARHQLGLFLVRDKNVPEAIKELSAITNDYPSLHDRTVPAR